MPVIGTPEEPKGIEDSPEIDFINENTEVTDFDMINGEKVAMMVKVISYKEIDIHVVNRSAVNAVTFKVYHCPSPLPPEDTTDDNVREISGGGVVVAVGTMSDPWVGKNNYYWIIITITSAAAENDIVDIYFQGSNP